MVIKNLSKSFAHQSVLLKEATDEVLKGGHGFYIDGTFGRGGHSSLLLKNKEVECLYAFDQDISAIEYGQMIAKQEPRLKMIHDNFSCMDKYLQAGTVSGIILDLGVSSPQLDDATRGFSFKHNGPLDMRMNTNSLLTAAKWLNAASEKEIAQVLWEYGEERRSRQIARAIVEARKNNPFSETKQLVELVKRFVPAKKNQKHPATRTFQAIRIHINQELVHLEKGLQIAVDLLKPSGRLVVIAFHSLEDRIVKRFMRRCAKGDDYPIQFAIEKSLIKPSLQIVGKPIKPDDQAMEANVRCRSAIMRVASRLP